MDLALQQDMSVNIIDRVKIIADMCRISKLEKLLSDCLENMPDNSPVEYIGELNKNDIMH